MSHALFDAIKKEKGIDTDAELSGALGLNRSAQVNRYRHGHDPITASLILRIYDFSGFSIERIRELAADTITPPVKVRRSKAAQVIRDWNPVASFSAKAVAPAVATPAKSSRVKITEAPQWVSRVHRIM